MTAGSKPDEAEPRVTRNSSDGITEAILAMPLIELVRSYQALHPNVRQSTNIDELSILESEKILLESVKDTDIWKDIQRALTRQREIESIRDIGVIRLLILEILAPTFAVWGYSAVVFLVVGAFVFSFTGEPLTLIIVGGICFSIGVLGSYLTIGKELGRDKIEEVAIPPALPKR